MRFAAGPGGNLGHVDLRRVSAEVGEIANLRVDPTARRQGIATQLMQSIVQRAPLSGMHTLQLVARPSDSAITQGELVGFYSRFGFRVAGQVPGKGPLLVRGNPLAQTVQQKPVLPRVAVARIVQRMEDDKYARQNSKAAGAIGTIAEAKKTKEGNKRITLTSMGSPEFAKKLATFSSVNSSASLITEVVSVVARVNAANGKVRAVFGKYPLMFLRAEQKEQIAADAYEVLILEIGKDLREPHVHRVREGNAAVSPQYLRDNGDVTAQVMACSDPVKLAWWYYAKYTVSRGWEKMTGLTRPHVPHFAELQVGGFVPRVVYDWWNGKFYATPHYNEVPEKGLDNPFIKLSKGHTWDYHSVENVATNLTK